MKKLLGRVVPMLHAVETSHNVELLADVGHSAFDNIAGDNLNAVPTMNGKQFIALAEIHRVGEVVDERSPQSDCRAPGREKSEAATDVANRQALRSVTVEGELDVEGNPRNICKLPGDHVWWVGTGNLLKRSYHVHSVLTLTMSFREDRRCINGIVLRAHPRWTPVRPNAA